MQSFVVMQGQTYQEEKELGIIWSLQQDSGGKERHSWLRMTEVNEGDRIFHYVKGNIVAISVAKTDAKWRVNRQLCKIMNSGMIMGI